MGARDLPLRRRPAGTMQALQEVRRHTCDKNVTLSLISRKRVTDETPKTT